MILAQESHEPIDLLAATEAAVRGSYPVMSNAVNFSASTVHTSVPCLFHNAST